MITRDAVFNGVQIREGGMMLIPFAVQGLDDREFDDPLTVDFRPPTPREPGVRHRHPPLPGTVLARAELRTFLRIWLERIPDFTLDPDKPPVATTGVISFLHSLPLKWDVPLAA